MVRTERTDIHRPSAPEFDPQAYELLGCFDNCTDPLKGGGSQEFRMKVVNDLIDRGYKFGPGSTFQCGHCGHAPLRYIALMARPDVKEMIYVGETCLDGRFEMTKPEFDRLRKAAQLNRERQRLLTAFTEACEAHQPLAYATYMFNIREALNAEATDRGFVIRKSDEYDTRDFADLAGTAWGLSTAADIAHKARQYGDPSEKQLALVERIVGEQEAKWAAYVKRETDRMAEDANAPDWTPGRQAVEGVILTIKEQDDLYSHYGGTTYKMLVKTDDGRKAWGTRPQSIWQAEKGDRVRFTALIKPKSGEESFAYLSRPTQASILATADSGPGTATS